MFVKVCGIKTFAQIDDAICLGYDAVGFVMHKPSKRYVNEAKAAELISYAKGRIKTFVVGVVFDEVEEVFQLADYVQVSEAVAIPNLAYASKTDDDVPCALFVYDASRGAGVFSDYPQWVGKYRSKLLLSGGLNPDNVSDVISQYDPYGVDVSSGIEKDGVKDYELMKRFIASARGV